MKFVFGALLLHCYFSYILIFEKSFLELFFFYFVGIHCKFYFPYSNRLITFSPSLHNMNRLRIGMQKIPIVDKKSPRGIKEGALNLVKCERIRIQRVLLFSFQVNSLFLHSLILSSSLFSLNSLFFCQGDKDKAQINAPSPLPIETIFNFKDSKYRLKNCNHYSLKIFRSQFKITTECLERHFNEINLSVSFFAFY